MAIKGRVTAGGREAVIAVEVLGGNGRRRAWIEAVLDTGFTGYLTLPNDMAASLSLAPRGSRDAVLADGSVVDLDVYRARVVWHGRERPVSVLGAEGAPLVGMALLSGSELRIQVTGGGEVTVEELP